jgi:hypothetical protein
LLLLPFLLILQLSAQLRFSLSELLLGLLHLGVAGTNGLIERLGILQPSLDQLILQLGSFLPLDLELVLVLGGKLLLGS